jgi:hypothetical protein
MKIFSKILRKKTSKFTPMYSGHMMYSYDYLCNWWRGVITSCVTEEQFNSACTLYDLIYKYAKRTGQLKNS